MKKSLIAFAALAAVGAASAQSSVTLYGLIDANVGKDIGSPAKRLSQGASSRLGVRGSEDLGGGMSAIFQFEHRFTPVNGQINGGSSATANATTSGNSTTFWQARSYVGLKGGFGTVKLGREYNGAFFHSQVVADPWGWDTVASTLTTGITGGGPNVNQTNTNNAITYESPTLGGFSFTGQVAESNNNGGVAAGAAGALPGTTALLTAPKKPVAFGASYAMGGLKVGIGSNDSGAVNNKWTSAHANYNFGVAKLWAFVGKGKNTANQDVSSYMLSATAPVGAGEFRVAYGQRKTAGVVGLKGVAAGYHYSLSKRTTIYADVVNNNKATTEKNGYDFGVKHAF